MTQGTISAASEFKESRTAIECTLAGAATGFFAASGIGKVRRGRKERKPLRVLGGLSLLLLAIIVGGSQALLIYLIMDEEDSEDAYGS